jgi:hypothetical protein
LTSSLKAQNPELGLGDMNSIKPLFKTGPRDKYYSHWVIETDPDTFNMMENKKVYLGMSRCSVKLYKNLPQCFKCQKFGHTALKCKMKDPVCKKCAGNHDSRECTSETIKCSNCGGKHMASFNKCKSKTAAIALTMRRTDFGDPSS